MAGRRQRTREVTNLTADPLRSPDGIEIRPAEAADADAVQALLADLVRTLTGKEDCGSSVEDILHHGFGETPHFEVLIAEAGGTAVGMVLFFYNYSTWRGRLGVYVQDIHVVEPFRSRGLGGGLLAAAARRGRAKGCTHLRLSVHPENEAALAFYERMGLEVRRDEAICQVSGVSFHLLAEVWA